MSVAFFHRCADGFASLAIVKMYDPEVYAIGIGYHDPVPFDRIKENDTVYILDITFPYYDMVKLHEQYKVYWFDHVVKKDHREEYKIPVVHHTAHGSETTYTQIDGMRDPGRASCCMVWEFFVAKMVKEQHALLDPKHPLDPYILPKGLQYIEDYELWRHKYPETLMFQRGIALYEHRLYGNQKYDRTDFWPKIILDDKTLLEEVVESGTMINQSVELLNMYLCLELAFKIIIDDYTLLVANYSGSDSTFFKSMLEEDGTVDAVMFFVWNNRQDCWKCTLYRINDTIDVSEIAKKFGGGGREGAAGFSCNKLPFDRIVVNSTGLLSPEDEYDHMREVWSSIEKHPLLAGVFHKMMVRGFFSSYHLMDVHDHPVIAVNSPLTPDILLADAIASSDFTTNSSLPGKRYCVMYTWLKTQRFKIAIIPLKGEGIPFTVPTVKVDGIKFPIFYASTPNLDFPKTGKIEEILC